MRPAVPVLAGLLLFVARGAASAQSIAELLPAKTLAYVELRQPAALAKEVAALLEGSYLSNVPESLAPLHAKSRAPRPRGPDMMAIVGVALAPEMLQEFGRIKGAALAVTGMDKEEAGMPEFVVIIQPGESNMPGLMMRIFMASYASSYGTSDGKVRIEGSTTFERVGEVEGVGLYRYVDRRFEGDAEPKVRIRGPALARLPDALLVGSPELVKQVIRRAKNIDKSAALAGVAAFQKARQDATAAPGFFAFANPAAVMDLLERLHVLGDGREMPLLRMVLNLVNPKAFVAVADQLTLENATLHYRRRVYLDPKEKSPIVELLPKGPVPQNLLHFAPPDALLFAALANDDGEKRWQRLVDLADTFFKGGGDRDLPSRAVAEFERGLGFSIGKDVIGKIRGAAIAMPGMQQLLKAMPHHQPPGVLIVEATDEQAAATLAQDVVPKVFTLMAREKGVKASERKVGGHTLRVLETRNGKYTMNYGREGSTLVLGPHGTAVALALTHGQKKQGLLADEKNGKRLQNLKDPIAIALVRPMAVAGGAYIYYVSAHGPAEPGQPPPELHFGEFTKDVQQLLDMLKGEQPLLLSLRRTSGQLAAEATYPGLRPLVARLTNFALEQQIRVRLFHERQAREQAKEAK